MCLSYHVTSVCNCGGQVLLTIDIQVITMDDQGKISAIVHNGNSSLGFIGDQLEYILQKSNLKELGGRTSADTRGRCGVLWDFYGPYHVCAVMTTDRK